MSGLVPLRNKTIPSPSIAHTHRSHAPAWECILGTLLRAGLLAVQEAGASKTAFPRWSMGTIKYRSRSSSFQVKIRVERLVVGL